VISARQFASEAGRDRSDFAVACSLQIGLRAWQTVGMSRTYWIDLFTIETWRESSRIGPGRPVKHMLKGADPVPVDGPATANSSCTRPARSRRRGRPNRLSG
jgi:hypothetical protein